MRHPRRTPRDRAALPSTRTRSATVALLLILGAVVSLTGCDALTAVAHRRLESRATKAMKEHRFELDRAGWEAIKPRGRAIVSLCRVREGKVVSYADVRVVRKAAPSVMKPEDDEKAQVAMVSSLCRAEPRATGELERTTLNGLNVYACTWEGPPEKVDRAYTYASHFVVAPPGYPYDYFVSTSSPKEEEGEAREVKRLLESFRVTR